jgi:hypothetical protein
VALIDGMLLSFDDPVLGVVPTVIPFQYNPQEVTRVFRARGAADGPSSQAADGPATEEYSLTVELDATDGLEVEGPLTLAMGVSPRLAAMERLMQPVDGGNLLADALGALGVGGGAAVPARRLPVVLFAWGPTRITPVKLSGLTIRETSFDALLHPIHASAELSLTVLHLRDLPAGDVVARAMAEFYAAARDIKAAMVLPQAIEWAVTT